MLRKNLPSLSRQILIGPFVSSGPPPETSNVLSDVNARLLTQSVCPGNTRTTTPSDKRRTRMLRSLLTLARYAPSGETATALTQSLWPEKSGTGVPVAMEQILTVLS